MERVQSFVTCVGAKASRDFPRVYLASVPSVNKEFDKVLLTPECRSEGELDEAVVQLKKEIDVALEDAKRFLKAQR